MLISVLKTWRKKMESRAARPARRSRRLEKAAQYAFHSTPMYPAVEVLEDRTLLSTIVWDGGGGDFNWNNPLNWSTDTLPTAEDDVEISTDFAGITIVHTSDTTNINSLVSHANVTMTGGTFSIASEATVSGTLTIQAATLGLQGVSQISSLTMASQSATLNGSGDVHITGAFDWIGGTMSGSGVTNIPATVPMTLSGNAIKTLGRTLHNAGTATWSGVGPFNVSGEFQNLADGVFEIQSEATMGLQGSFHNAGLLVKSAGTGISVLDVSLTNAAQVQVQSGTLSLRRDAAHSGTFDLAAGAALEFVRNHTLGESASITGDGTLQVGTSGAASAQVTLQSAQTLAKLRLGPFNSAITLDAALVVEDLVMTSQSATLNGSGDVHITGAFDWMGGTMSGSGVTHIPATVPMTLSGNGIKTLGRTLHNAGTATWGGVGAFNISGEFQNLADGVFEIQSDASMGLQGSFHNAGLLVKSAGTGISTLDVSLTNAAQVQVQSGTLRLTGGFTQTGGGTLLAGGQLESTQTLNLQGGSLAGIGTVTANVSNSGGQVAPGLMGAGTLTIAGNYTQGPAGSLAIEIGGLEAGAEFDQLVVAGTAALAGTLTAELIGDFVPQVGNAFLVVAGTTTGGFTVLDLPALPAGRLWELQDGSVTLAVVGQTAIGFWDGGGDGTSWHDPLNWSNDILPGPDDDVVIDVPGSQTIVHSQGDTVIKSLTSHEAIVIQGGSLSLAEDSTVEAEFTLTGDGLLTGDGRLTLGDLFVWSGGTMAGTGVTVSTDRLRIEGAEPKYLLNTRTLNNQGDMLWTGGEVFRGLDAPTFNNLAGATFIIQTDDDFLSGPTAAGQINNAGHIIKSTSVGTASLKSPLTSTGIVEVQTGVLRFIGGYTQGGDGQLLLAGGNVESNVGFNLQGGELRGYGRIVGHVQSSAAIDVGGQFDGIGRLEIIGDFQQTPAGTIQIDLAGPTPGTSYDQLAITGSADLAGTLAVTLSDGFQPPTGFGFDVLTYGSQTGQFSSITGLDLPGGRTLQPDYAAQALVLTVQAAPGGFAEDVHQMFEAGVDQLRGVLESWAALFHFDQIELPVLGEHLETVFGLPGRLADFAQNHLPSTGGDSVDSFDELRDLLESLGFTVICLDGASLIDGEECEVGDLVRVRFERLFEDITVDAQYNPNTPGVFEGLLGSGGELDLGGQLSASADLWISLVFGVDGDGFYLDRDSRVELQNVEAAGAVAGTGDVAGQSGVALSTSGAVNATISLASVALQLRPETVRYRTEQFESSVPPINYLAAGIDGTADLTVDLTLGPADLTWTSQFTISTDDQFVISVGHAAEFTGDLTLPGLTDGNGETATFHLAGTLVGDVWTLQLVGEATGTYELADFAIENLDLQLTITPDTFAGTFHADLQTTFGDDAVVLDFAIDAQFDNNSLQLEATGTFGGQTVLNGQYIGTVLWIDQAQAVLHLDLAFGPEPTIDLEVLVTAETAVLFPEDAPAGTVPDGAATATGLSGTLTSGGNLSLTAQDVVVEASNAFDLTVQHLTLTVGPAFSAGNIATLEQMELSFPAFPELLAVVLGDVSLSYAGALTVGTFTVGDGNTNLTLGSDPVLAALDGFLLEGADLSLQVADGGVRNWSGSLTFSATSATLFPAVGTAGLAGAQNVSGAIDLGSGALSLSTGQITTALVPAVGGILPLQIDGVDLIVADPRDLDTFALTVTGRFDFEPFLSSLGFTPIVIIDGAEVTAADAFVLELSADGLRGGLARPVGFGPVTLGIAGLTIPGTDSVLDGELTIGRLGADGLPEPIPGGDAQVAGFVTVTGGSQFPIDLQIDVLGNLTLHADGSSSLAVTGTALMEFDPDGAPIVGGASAHFNFQIDASPLAFAPFLDLQVQATLASVTFTDIVFDLSPVIHLEVGQASFFFDEPGPDGEVANLLDVIVTFPSFPEWGSSTIDAMLGFDDDGDGVIDGFQIVAAAFGLSGVIERDGLTLLELTNFQVLIPFLSYRNGTLAGEIQVMAESAVLLPEGGAEGGVASVTDLRGFLDFDGRLVLDAGALTMQLGEAVHIAATGDLDADPIVPAVQVIVDPNHTASDVLATVFHAVLTLPSLDGAPTTTLENLEIRRNGLSFDSLIIGGFDFELGDILHVTGMTVGLQNFSLTVDGPQRTLTGELVVTADSAVLFPGSSLTASIVDNPDTAAPALQGSINLQTGAVELTVDRLLASLGGGVEFEANTGLLRFAPNDAANALLFSVQTAALTIPLFESDVVLSAVDVQILRNGQFSLQSAAATAPDGGFLAALGLGGLLPFDLQSVTVAALPGQRIELNEFAADITVVGLLDFSLFEDSSLPMPIVEIGDQTVNPDSPSVTATFRVENGQVRIQNMGPITLGFEDLTFGPVTLGTTVTLGGYVDGVFDTSNFGATMSVAVEGESLSFDVEVIVTGGLEQITTAGGVPATRLTLDVTPTVSFEFEDLVSFQELTLPFHLSLTVDQNLLVVDSALTLQGISAEEIVVNFGGFVNMRAEQAEIVFPDPAESTVWSLEFASLELSFGSGDEDGGGNPLAGLGGGAGNFRVSFDTAAAGLDGLLFTPLDEFFIDVLVPDGFKFGLPDWLPFEARKIGLKFDVDVADGLDAGQPVQLEDMTVSAIRFSGGLQGNDLWPITGQVENMEVDLGRLAAYGQRLIEFDYAGLTDLGPAIVERGLEFFDGLEFPITNLDLVEFAIEPIDLGGMAIGGGLGLGLLSIDGNGDGERDQTALYGRILGQVVVSEVGIGVELIVTEYGPVLARLFAGIPIPIGAIVGAAVGVWFFGVGAAAGAQIGDSTGFMISGFEGGINFGDNRIEIDDPLQLLNEPILFNPLSVDLNSTREKVEEAAQRTHQLLNDGDPTSDGRIYTWNDGFTITGAGTLTNKYVAGMIGGTLTVGMNVGFPDLVGVDDEGRQFGVELFASGSIDILGMSLANTGVVFDFNDPLSPGVHMAFGLPGINGDLLGMLLPATGQFGASFTTDGVLYGGVLAAGKLLTDIVQGGLAANQAFFDATIDVIADRLEVERLTRLAQEGGWDPLSDKLWLRPSRLLQIVLDVDGTGTFPTHETQAVTKQFLIDRLLDLLTNVNPNDLLIPANVADAIINQIMEVGSQLAPQFDIDPLEVATMILSHAKQTLQASLTEFLSVADPSFTVEGFIQPTLMGIPFGPPQNRVELRLDKNGVQFGFDTTLASLFNAATAVLSAMGMPDITVGMTVSLPIGQAILNALLAEGPLDPLEPNDPGWGVEIHSSLRVAGFDVGTVKGLMIPPDANPATFLADHIQLVYQMSPDAVLDPTKIPIHTEEHYNALISHGGILLSGLMQAPKLLTDPLDVFAALNLTPPEDVLQYPGWLGDIAGELGQIVNPAQIQLFIPSLHKALVTQELTINQVLADAYLAGTWEGKLLSIPLAKGRIEGTSEGLLVMMEEPLLGLEIEFLVDFPERIIDGAEVQFPRAQGSVVLDTTKSEQIFASLELPPHLLSQFGSASGSLRAFSPGFSDNPNEPDQLKRTGGFEFSGQLNANLWNTFQAAFAGSMNSEGAFHFAASNLPFEFQLFGGRVTGNTQFAVDRGGHDQPVDFSGSFAGSLYVPNVIFNTRTGNWEVHEQHVASVAAEIDEFGCLTAKAAFFSGGLVLDGDYALTPNACSVHLLVHDLQVVEGDFGQHTADVQVELSSPAPAGGILVTYAVEVVLPGEDSRPKASGTGTQRDFIPVPFGSVHVPAGHSSAQIPVTIIGDTRVEPDEIFRVRILSASGAHIADGTAIVTIIDDDTTFLFTRPTGAVVYYDFQTVAGQFETSPDFQADFAAGSQFTHSAPSSMFNAAGLPVSVADGAIDFGLAAGSGTWGSGHRFQFTVSATDGRVELNELQFWDRPFTSGALPQEWDVFWSIDNYSAPLPISHTVTLSADTPTGATPLDPAAFGWRLNRIDLPALGGDLYQVLPTGIICADCGIGQGESVTFRLVGKNSMSVLVENVAVIGAPVTATSDLDRIAAELHEFMDRMAGRVSIEVFGRGYFEAILTQPSFDDIDPIPYQQLVQVTFFDTDASTQIVVSAADPSALPIGEVFSFGEFVFNGSVQLVDMSGVGNVHGDINAPRGVGEFRFDNVADGTRITLGGSPGDRTGIFAHGRVGHPGGMSGVDVTTPGELNTDVGAWHGGHWDIGRAGTVITRNGDFSASVDMRGGFSRFEVHGGDFRSPAFRTGLDERLGGAGGAIEAFAHPRGGGGSIHVGRMNVRGGLDRFEAHGGDIIAGHFMAHHVNSIAAFGPSELSRTGGSIGGGFEMVSLGLMHSIGGVVSATLVTHDGQRNELRVLAEPDQFGRGGIIDSRFSFHIAGGVESIIATEIYLTLIAGGHVELIEAMPDAFGRPAALHGNFTAESFGAIRSHGNNFDLHVYPQRPVSTTAVSLSQMQMLEFPGPNGGTPSQLLGLDVVYPRQPLHVTFQSEGADVTAPLRLASNGFAAVNENVPGRTIGPVTAPAQLGGVPTVYSVSDDRFEVVDGQLQLKPGRSLSHADDDGLTVVVSATNAAGTLDMTQAFEIIVDEFPPPIVTAVNASGQVGVPIPLNISASLSDLDGSDRQILTIEITGLPAGATLSAGIEQDGRWILTPDQLDGLTITLQQGGEFSLTITAVAADQFSDDAVTAETALLVAAASTPPVIVEFHSSSPYLGGAAQGRPVSVSATFSYAGLLTTHRAWIDWGDGSPLQEVAVTQSNGQGTISAGHVYQNGGIYTVRLTLTNGDQQSDTATATMVIAGAGIHDGVLHIIGTNNRDRIRVSLRGRNQLLVRANFLPERGGRRTFDLAGVRMIYIVTGAGNDRITIARNVRISAIIDAGRGNDRIRGGGGPTVILGGPGNDRITGSRGPNIIASGTGSNRVTGSRNSDLIISGSTAYDANAASQILPDRTMLELLLAEWASGRDLSSRIQNLTNGTGSANRLNGDAYLKRGETAFDDARSNRINGRGGDDWLFSDWDDDQLAASHAGVFLNDLNKLLDH
jgi:hypothetical protein